MHKEYIDDDMLMEIYNFRKEIADLFDNEKAVYLKTGLQPKQYHALLVLKAKGDAAGMRIGVFAEELRISPSTATALVDRMERSTLVKRIAHGDDRRSLNIILTQIGERRLNEALKVDYVCMSRILKSMHQLFGNHCETMS